MYKKMLVALDGSELAETVLVYTEELMRWLPVDVTLLHVCSPREKELLSIHQAYLDKRVETLKGYSDGMYKLSGEAGIGIALKVQKEIVMGHPAEKILQYAEENDIDLILMATHGRSGVKRWAIGSVADKVLRASDVPVWIIRPGIVESSIDEELMMRNIIVPLDGSELAESVIPHVEALVNQRGAEFVDVTLLGVCNIPIIPECYGFYIPLMWDEQVKAYGGITKQYLAKIEKRLTDIGLRASSHVLVPTNVEDNPAESIINYTVINPCDLIMMSTHGHSGIKRWAFGSVADRVLRGASAPIFLIRAQ